jgi:hypothetical protein
MNEISIKRGKKRVSITCTSSYIHIYIQIEIFNPSLQPIIVNTSELSVELKWPFDTKIVKFNKFSIIYKKNDSNKELYFIQNGK